MSKFEVGSVTHLGQAPEKQSQAIGESSHERVGASEACALHTQPIPADTFRFIHPHPCGNDRLLVHIQTSHTPIEYTQHLAPPSRDWLARYPSMTESVPRARSNNWQCLWVPRSNSSSGSRHQPHIDLRPAMMPKCTMPGLWAKVRRTGDHFHHWVRTIVNDNSSGCSAR